MFYFVQMGYGLGEFMKVFPIGAEMERMEPQLLRPQDIGLQIITDH